ncbi:MAG: hypothetical protein LBU92_04690, partial [Prevotellaceae bacterium]|nr:hypothetical protein [Prevotellaceae bacterium]
MGKLTQFFSNKVAFTAALLILLCLGVWLYFFIREGEKKNSMDARRAIPADAAFVLRANDLNQLTRTLGSDGEMARLVAADGMTRDLRSTLSYIVDSLAQKNVAAGDLIQQPLWISAHVFGSELSFLYSLNLPETQYLSDVRQVIELLAQAGYAPHEQAYDDEKIITFKRADVDVFHASLVRRVLVVSTSRVLVEMAIRQAKSPASLADNANFMQAAQTAGAHVAANLYINHQQLPRLMPLCLGDANRRQLSFASRAGTFTVLDAELRSEALQLNGFLFFDPAAPSYFSVLAKQKSQKLTTFDVLPRATDAVVCLGVTDVRQLLSAYNDFRERQQNGNAARREKLAQLRKKLSVEAGDFFTSLYPAELAVARVPMVGLNEKDTRFIILKSSKIDEARAALSSALAQAAKAEEKQDSDFVATENMSNGEPLTMYRNPAPGLLSALQGDLFSTCNDAYFTFIGEYIVFASSQVAMREFALAALLKKTLSQSVDLSEYTTSESNAIIYVNPAKSDAFAQNLLKPELQKLLKKSPLIAASHGVGLQLRAMGDKMYCNAFFKVAPKIDEKKNSQGLNLSFEVKLDAPISAAPFVVKNHKSGQKEIFVQDKNNTLYLIDNQGVMLWKKQIDEPIMGRVQQVDFYRNNKLQLLFNTRTKMHLLDRLGRNVEKFPVALSSPATAPLAVFDYDRSRDYRYFIPCEDKKIRAYERDGKPLTGFSPQVVFAALTQTPMHVRARDKDYLVVADEQRVHILNRKGEERVRVKEAVAAARALFVEHDLKGNALRLVTTDAEGSLVFIYLDGTVEHSKLKQKSGEHYFCKGNISYAILDEKELR